MSEIIHRSRVRSDCRYAFILLGIVARCIYIFTHVEHRVIIGSLLLLQIQLSGVNKRLNRLPADLTSTSTIRLE